jgi:hypothetical protein
MMPSAAVLLSAYAGEVMNEPTTNKDKSYVPALLGAIAAIIVAITGLIAVFMPKTDATLAPDSDSIPITFRGDLANIDYARELSNLLLANSGKSITLDVECEDANSVEDHSRCGSTGGGEYFILATGRETFKEYWTRPTDSIVSPPVWILFKIPDGVPARMANSPKGAGYLRAQGTFAILKSTSGVVPPDAEYYELTAVSR